MIRILAITQDRDLRLNLPLERLSDPEIAWYWVDYNVPTQEEIMTLESHFHFHPLAIEDCLHLIQRPKLDHYDNVHFFVLHAMNEQTLALTEMDLFLGDHFMVSFHTQPLMEVESAWQRIIEQNKLWPLGPIHAAYLLMDKLVDQYFPSVYLIEDQLTEIENKSTGESIHDLMNQVFEIRGKLLKLRRTILPMRDLLYRILNTQKIEGLQNYILYFTDIHDHLLKLSDMIESNREMTADLRDSYISLNSNRMNTIMKTLTVITTIFMPLTFIAGIYGMNFEFMPELAWRPGYFIILAVMGGIGFGMYLWFRRKGWFE